MDLYLERERDERRRWVSGKDKGAVMHVAMGRDGYKTYLFGE